MIRKRRVDANIFGNGTKQLRFRLKTDFIVACENSRPSPLSAQVAFPVKDRAGSEEGRLFSQANFIVSRVKPFSSPEAALLFASTKNRDLWPGPTPEVRDSRTSRHSAHVQSQL